MSEKDCNTCKHGKIQYCVGADGQPLPKLGVDIPVPEIPDQQSFWTYVECKKNFGLPKAAYINNCPLWIKK